MPKDIAVVAYDLDPTSSLTQDAVVIRDQLNSAGYKAELVHQWSFDETNSATFKSQDQWEKYDGVVICNFYESWNLRELIRSARPTLCVNVGYVDDCGVAEGLRTHTSEEKFKVIDNSHPITAGFPLGVLDIGAPVFFDSVSTLNHHVDVLVTTLASEAVLAAHKTHPLSYFAWYRMSQAPAGSPLFKLLVQTANWTFSGP
ncbi:MAG TPA: hypothetical protein VLX28_09725 [Thermoanaerobaculia bacterium]|nr:hypothetical protein [Thermoanaerobaculia bacterium]